MRLTDFATFLLLLLHALCHAIPRNSLEPTEDDLTCFNDYDTEMKCHLSSDSVQNCSEYALNVTHSVIDTLNNYSCIFEQSHLSASDCECQLKVLTGFVIMEIFYTTLLKERNVLFSKQLKTQEFIKPKTPVLSVQKTENGNFKITWDNMYNKSESSPFLRSLRIKLIYGIKGENEKITLVEENSVKFYEIISRNLKPKTTYVLTASMMTGYNPESYSDESTEYEFTTSSSPNEQLRIIPAICVVLIIIIFIVFILIFSIKRVWWDKISKPKINNIMGEQNNKTLLLPFMSISPIRVDISKCDLKEENKLILASSVDRNGEQSSNSVDSAVVDYAQTCPESQKQDNNIIALTQRALNEVFKFPLLTKQPPVLLSYNQVPVMGLDTSFQKGYNCSNRDSGNCSGTSDFSNKAYFTPQAEETCDDFYKIEEPNITKLLVSENPLYPTSNESCTIAYDDGYQDVQNLIKDTKEQWNSTTNTEIALSKCGAMKVFETEVQSSGRAPTFQQSSWTSSLPIMSNIQIDDSYHPV